MAKIQTTRGVVDAAERVARHLDAVGARYALIGGLAVGARAEPRYTRDVDFAVSVEADDQAEAIIHQLGGAGYRVGALVEQTKAGRLATARLRSKHDEEVFVDLLFASSGIEPELVAAAEPLAYRPGVTLAVATIGHLIALKVLSESDRRLQDRLDLMAMSALATDDDWRVAERAVRLIRERGYHRGRALRTRLRRWRRAT